jgi:hypothetical protein
VLAPTKVLAQPKPGATADGIKALVYDVFGTCVDWRNGVARDAERILRRLIHDRLAAFAGMPGARSINRAWKRCAPGVSPSSSSTSCTGAARPNQAEVRFGVARQQGCR